MATTQISFLIFASILLFVRAEYVVIEVYNTTTCDGSSAISIYSVESCTKDFSDNTYHYYTVESGTNTVSKYGCSDPGCTSCTGGAIGVTGTCYLGIKYQVSDTIEDGVGIMYYSDSNCQTPAGAQIFHGSNIEGTCIPGPSDNYKIECDNNDIVLNMCPSDDCSSGCDSQTYSSKCTSVGGYYTKANCGSSNSGTRIVASILTITIISGVLLMLI